MLRISEHPQSLSSEATSLRFLHVCIAALRCLLLAWLSLGKKIKEDTTRPRHKPCNFFVYAKPLCGCPGKKCLH